MKKRNMILIMILLSFAFNVSSQIVISGYAYLTSQSNHDSIAVILEQTLPGSKLDTAYTNSAGFYSIAVDIGVYNIQYVKQGYYVYSEDNLDLFSDSTLHGVSLVEWSNYLQVPASFSTIQAAINAARTNDTIVVSNGIYYENIDFSGKSVVLTSNYIFSQDTSDINNTVIDGSKNGRVVKFVSGEKDAALIGFTIRNGYNLSNHEDYGKGGGIAIKYQASPTLEYLKICHNEASLGGGIYIYESTPHIRNTTIVNNIGYDGGGIEIDNNGGAAIVENCKIANNTGHSGGGIEVDHGSLVLKNSIVANNTSSWKGGGIAFYVSTGTIINSTIVNNKAASEGGGIIDFGGNLAMHNCIVANNTGDYGVFVAQTDPATIDISYSNVCNNQSGNFFNCGNYIGKNVTTNANGDSCDLFKNISMDPLFADSNDFILSSNSPCIDAGANSLVVSQLDFLGNLRIQDGDGDNNAIVDMGAIEVKYVSSQLIGGKVFAGQHSFGCVYLYEIDSLSGYTLIDSTTFDTSGIFLFPYFNSGTFVLQAVLDCNSNDCSDYAPTYYEDAIYWANARLITSSGQNYNIYMEQINAPLVGPGKVSGSITKKVGSNYVKIPNILVMLLDGNGDVKSYQYSDPDGNFEFSDLPFGSYKMHVELTGTKTYDIAFEISESQVVYSGMNIQVNSTNSLDEDQADLSIVGLAYPNPFGQTITIPIKSLNPFYVDVELRNILGQIVFVKDELINDVNYRINVNQLSNGGIYLLTLRNHENGNMIYSIKLVKN